MSWSLPGDKKKDSKKVNIRQNYIEAEFELTKMEDDLKDQPCEEPPLTKESPLKEDEKEALEDEKVEKKGDPKSTKKAFKAFLKEAEEEEAELQQLHEEQLAALYLRFQSFLFSVDGLS